MATASPGRANAGSCVAGSITRSGRITTHPVSATKITLASAAIPGVVSVRPFHDVGDSEPPMPLPEIRAATQAVLKMANARVSSHADRRKRTVRMYSTPSGHAVAISTSDPNSTATPSEIRSRESPSGPPDPDSGVLVLPVGVTAPGGAVDPVAGAEPAVAVVTGGASAATLSLATVNV